MTKEEIGNAIINESSNILGCIEGEIENKFKRYGSLLTNRGTKGSNLENAVKRSNCLQRSCAVYKIDLLTDQTNV
jgi:hypothetical protein